MLYGLSPYTRGNQDNPDTLFEGFGSIPVHTGKPLSDMPIFLVLRVYPRTHGETLSQLLQGLQNQGLSPYTRGNLINHWEDSPAAGSIPVHTGKPLTVPENHKHHKVYPRTHGETSCWSMLQKGCEGLSPYTRGNLVGLTNRLDYDGSIPVHTGKPSESAARSHTNGVYPRTHGETSFRFRYVRRK